MLRVVERVQVLQQADHHLSHDTAEQSSSQQNIDSYICVLRPVELNFRKYRDNSDRTWLNSFKCGCCSGEEIGRCAGHYGTRSEALRAPTR
jgi:hypothetical protein